jgi:tetratricopeptide (TPR) repeat protein
VITKPEQHEINRAGKRLLREVLEPLTWVVNDVQEDYGIDCNIQVFDGKFPTGAWFHVQLKSSASSDYSADRAFISQELLVDHARHYALEMRDPIFLIHADVTSKRIYWCAPQLDRRLAEVLGKTGATFITVRIPTHQQLPTSAPDLLTNLDNIYLVLGAREVSYASIRSFTESLPHLPDQDALHRAFQEKTDTLKLRRILELFTQKQFDQARRRVESLLGDPDSTIEIKFWAQLQSEGIDYEETVRSGNPQVDLSSLRLAHAKSLQKVTASGPNYLKFYSLIARKAAELEVLTHENFTLYMALQQHLQNNGNPMMALGLFAQRSVTTSRIVSKYNQCVRLARYAATYPNRWVLGRALTNVSSALASYLATLRSEGKLEVEKQFAQSALEFSKLAARICDETGDPTGVVLAIMSALTITNSTDSNAFWWANDLAQNLVDAEIRAGALVRIERAVKRWKGESVEGDYSGDIIWQAIQNMATALHIDLRNENDPLVRGLRIAARDNSPEHVLAHCEHLLVSLGATGPVARKIRSLFNISTAGSKVVHCTLHDFHVEGKDQDTAYAEFKRAHCDSCPDQKPRPMEWRFTDEVQRTLQTRHSELMIRLAGTPFGLRYTSED